MKLHIQPKKPRNLIAKDLFSPKYRIRVAASKKRYDRNASKAILRKEVYAG
mgnify:CR=1 FL=1